MTLEIILIIISIILSAFFSSSEAAFLSIQKTKLFHMVNLKQKGANNVAKLLENKDKLLSTIVLGNNIANIVFAGGISCIIKDIFVNYNDFILYNNLMLLITIILILIILFSKKIHKIFSLLFISIYFIFIYMNFYNN